jgi:hypothetical protein
MMHKLFIAFLFLSGITTVLAIGVHGFNYYSAPVEQRAFSQDHKRLKSSGVFGHSLGVIGASMVITGIIMYSARKRIRALWKLGRLSVWLEVHIFFCTVGTSLVVFHSTFKTSGIAAISFWSLLAVAASGVIGRFLYVLIPRTPAGNEMTSGQINEQFDAQEKILLRSEIGGDLRRIIDHSFEKIKRPENVFQAIRQFMYLQKVKRHVRMAIHAKLKEKLIERHTAHQLIRTSSARATLIQKSLLLIQIDKMFYYWHAIHLPFTGIMLLTLAAHVGVALWLGYFWIF